MPQIDYMKVIGALSRSLNLETIDMKFHDRSTDRIDIIMGADAVQERKFTLSLANFSVELVFSKRYLPEKDFEKWMIKFEYELEQAFVKNAAVHRSEDASNHILMIDI